MFKSKSLTIKNKERIKLIQRGSDNLLQMKPTSKLGSLISSLKSSLDQLIKSTLIHTIQHHCYKNSGHNYGYIFELCVEFIKT